MKKVMKYEGLCKTFKARFLRKMTHFGLNLIFSFLGTGILRICAWYFLVNSTYALTNKNQKSKLFVFQRCRFDFVKGTH